jgi:hypothetical protein
VNVLLQCLHFVVYACQRPLAFSSSGAITPTRAGDREEQEAIVA